MATISKRGEYQYQAIVRRKGYRSKTRTFETKREALDWATIVESEMTRSIFVDRSAAESITLGQALRRYVTEVTPKKKSVANERLTINRWLKHPYALRSLASLTTDDFTDYCLLRSEEVSAYSVRIELAIISHLFTILKKRW